MYKTCLSSSKSASRSLGRQQYLSLLRASLASKRFRYARDAALNWLGSFPGDLQVGLHYAKSLIGEGHPQLALPIIEGLCIADPEFNEAIVTLQRVILNTPAANNKSGDINRKINDAHLTSTIASQNLFVHNNIVPTWIYALNGPRNLSKQNSLGLVYKDIAAWGQPLWQARRGIKKGQLEQAEEKILSALGTDPPTPIIQVTHLEYLDAIDDTPLPAKLSIANHYHRAWPACLPITLYLAHWMMDSGDADSAVNLLHQVAARDVSGQVVMRMWGVHHPYISLWPAQLDLMLYESIPAEIANRLGWNLLPDRATAQSTTTRSSVGSSNVLPDFLAEELTVEEINTAVSAAKAVHNEPHDLSILKTTAEIEVLKSVKEEIERLAKRINHPGLTSLDGRYPIYVVFSVREGLENKYGEPGANLIITEMIKLVDSLDNKSIDGSQQGWGARIFIPDDPLTLKPFNIKPVKQGDPWKYKLAIRDLDDALAKRGEMIGALLIVGGPEVVPFHHLPNPIDDPDDYVASDNPYGTRDENYFIPEWPIGRLPGGRGTDPNLLINSLRRIQEYHSFDPKSEPWYRRWLKKLLSWLRPRLPNGSKSVGYSAAVWRQASQSVFSPIGAPRDLFTSPPLGINGNVPQAEDIPPLSHARLGYFNLHGLVDAPEWYGQSDLLESLDEPEFPIALRPQDIPLNGHISTKKTGEEKANTTRAASVPRVVFSEACYGANIMGKTIEEALSLMFLTAGSSAFMGSTSMSYGSISAPLIAADLLGHAFWRYLRDGVIAGEALRQAKIYLAQEMHSRQGYLDGEDQKTLISFVFYGDPLAQFRPSESIRKSISRIVDSKNEITTICDRSIDPTSQVNISLDEIDYVKRVVAEYLPGMSDAQLTCASERAVCHADGHVCPTSQLQSKGESAKKPTRKVVTLRKQVKKDQHLHNQYARITLDESGKLVKLVVSR